MFHKASGYFVGSLAHIVVSAAKDVVGGANSCSGKFGDEMLLIDGKRVVNLKKSVAGMAANA